MLEKPDLQDEKIITCVQAEYGLQVSQLAFLPLGADRDTAVYGVDTGGGAPYFLKLRGGVFDETSVTFPKFLSDQGVKQVIAPQPTQTGHLWADLETFKVILCPFVEGRNGYEVTISERHWHEFGAVLKSLHTVDVPSTIKKQIRSERYSARWRETVKMFLARIDHDEDEIFFDPLAVKTAAFLRTKREVILDLVARAGRLAQVMQAQSPEFIVCHADMHAGNILIDTQGAFYIVDWDTLMLAPKERDLMFIGAGLLGNGYPPSEEERLFYRGYSQNGQMAAASPDPIGLAYYRYERIIEDIAVECEEIFSTPAGGPQAGADREQLFYYLTTNFLPNNTIELAYRADSYSG